MKKEYNFEDKLDRIKEAILINVPAKYIYLFGSYAYGKPTKDSDIDIYTVIPDDTKDLLFLFADIKDYLDGQEISNIDIHLIKESKFLYRKTRSLFEENICTKGKLIYERA